MDGLCLDLRSPLTVQASGTVEADGVYRVSQTLPWSVSVGSDIYFQAVLVRGDTGFDWLKSEVAEVEVIETPRSASDLRAGDLVITEIMVRPAAVASEAGEWFEVYNPNSKGVDLDGLMLSTATATVVVDETVVIPGRGVAVLASHGSIAANGGIDVDYAYGSLPLDDLWGELQLWNGGTLVDGVAWDDGTEFEDVAGASKYLDGNIVDADRNDLGEHWCTSDKTYASGDYGTPGVRNNGCGPVLEFTGVLTDLRLSELGGWRRCFKGTYANSKDLDVIAANCDGSHLLLTCRKKDDTVLTVAAYAGREHVLYDTDTSNITHRANGVEWYFDQSWSWGFADEGSTVYRNSCDTESGDAEQRLCWHTSASRVTGGWRCGSTTSLNSSSDWERLVYTADL